MGHQVCSGFAAYSQQTNVLHHISVSSNDRHSGTHCNQHLTTVLDVCSPYCSQDGLKSEEGHGGADEEMAEADEAVKAAEEGGKVGEQQGIGWQSQSSYDSCSPGSTWKTQATLPEIRASNNFGSGG
jgi:hypothetical protein